MKTQTNKKLNENPEILSPQSKMGRWEFTKEIKNSKDKRNSWTFSWQKRGMKRVIIIVEENSRDR